MVFYLMNNVSFGLSLAMCPTMMLFVANLLFEIALNRRLSLGAQGTQDSVGINCTRVVSNQLFGSFCNLLRRLALQRFRFESKHDVMEDLTGFRRDSRIVTVS
jgi:hypothetical protein